MNTIIIENAFDKYTSRYHLDNPKINLKYIHTRKVAENSRKIAESLQLSKDDVDLNWEIGMLHDIGRFEQLRRFDTFSDAASIDHAQFGADLLFKDGLIQEFDDNKAHYDLIEKAIRCHSLYKLPKNLSIREQMFCNIIRDADKVDIFRANYQTGMSDIYNVTEDVMLHADITPAVFDTFQSHQTVLRSLKKTVADHLVGHLSLYFGLVYPKAKELTIEQGFLWKLAQFHSENPQTENTLNCIRAELKLLLVNVI